MPNLKKARFDGTRDLKIEWTDQQMIMLSERFGKQFLRMAAATMYHEHANSIVREIN